MAVTRRLRAILDLEEISDYLSAHGAAAALRFLDAAEATIQRLDHFPRLGRACHFRDPSLAGVRRRLVKGIKRYMIYYRPTDDGIEVLRVLHTARDVGSIFGDADD